MSEYFSNQDWLNSRLGRITASEIHKIFTSGKKKDELFGQTALTYLREKAAEILTQEVKEDVNARQMEWGKSHEYEACAAFQEWLGKEGIYYGAGNPKFFEHGDFEGCSPDWEIAGEIGADMKCPYNSAEHLKNLTIEGSEGLAVERWEYYCQLQHAMIIRGWECAYFVSYDPRFVYDHMKLRVIPVLPNPEWRKEYNARIPKAIDLLTDMVTKFARPMIAHHEPELNATIIQ